MKHREIAEKTWAALLLFAMPQGAQVYLRSGSPAVAITGATNTSPVVITAPSHGLQDGDVVRIQFVVGNTAANGLRKVKNPTADTFEITDLEGNNVSGNGTFTNVARPVVGKVSHYTIRDHPRLIYARPEVLARITDPDGDGAQTAPIVRFGSPCTSSDRSGCTPWDALESRLSGQTSANCDGVDPVLCAKEVAWNANKTMLAAVGWYADRSRTAWLNGVKAKLNNLHLDSNSWTSQKSFTACDQTAYHCGASSDLDWIAERIALYSLAYSLVRDQMSTAQRQVLANKFFNDHPHCANMLQKQDGEAYVTNGSAVVTGSGLSVYAPGDVIYIKTVTTAGGVGIWRTVASVQSDEQLTLTTTANTTAGPRDHYKVSAWNSSSCGIVWYFNNHGYVPGVLAVRGSHPINAAMNASQTYFSVNEISNFLDPAPFYVKIDSEWMRVTGITGTGPYTVNVERGVMYTAPAEHSTGRNAIWSRYPQANYGITSNPSFYLGPVTHNLSIQKMYGAIMAAIAFVGDDQRAQDILEKIWNQWFDYVYPFNKNSWTGVNGGGSNTGYGMGRWLTQTYSIVHWARFGLNPYIDLSGGDWLKSAVWWPLYLQYPYSPGKSPSFSDAGSVQELEWDDFGWAGMAIDLYAGSDEAKYLHNWLRNLSSGSGGTPYLHYTTMATSWGEETLLYYLLFIDDETPSADHRNVLPAWRFFTETDGPRKEPFAIAVSRSGWNSSADTHLTVLNPVTVLDHWHAYVGPGNYKIAKKTRLLDDNAPGGHGGSSGTNYVEVGGANNILSTSPRGSTFDRMKGGADYVYIRANTAGHYRTAANVTSAWRQIVHLKDAQEYVVAYDVVNTSVSNQKRTRLHYFIQDAPTGASLSRTGGDVVFTKGTAARISTKILLPEDSGKVAHTDTPSAYAYTVTMDDGWTSRSEFLVVHRPSGDPNDVMPAVGLLPAVGESFRGLAIDDADGRKIVVLGRDDRSSTVTFETGGGTGPVRILVTGLDPGIYSIVRNGQQVMADQNVGEDGTLSFTAEAGAFSIFKTGVLPLAIVTDSVPQATEGVSFATTLTAQGGVPPYSWAVIAGNLPRGLSLTASNGRISGTPGEAGAFTITVQVVDATQATTTKALTLTVEAAQQGLSILPEWLPDAVVGVAYQQQLSVASGTAPYAWSLASGALPEGLSLTASGLILGTPVLEGSGSFVVEVEDSGAPPATGSRAMELNVLHPLRITTTAMPEAVLGEAYSFELQASGGRPFYSWSLVAGTLPPGLTLNEAGRLSGTPAMSGVARVRLQVADSAQPPAVSTRELSLRIQTAAGSLGVQPAQWDSQRVQARYGRAGLDANQPCTLVLSTDAQFSNVIETVTDDGGAGTREHIFGLAASLDPQGTYYLRATCGAEQAQAMAVTAPEPPARLRRFRMSFRAPAIPGVSDVLIEYGSGATLDQSLVVPCTDACRAELLLPAGQLVRLRRTFRNAAGMPLAAGSPVAAVAP